MKVHLNLSMPILFAHAVAQEKVFLFWGKGGGEVVFKMFSVPSYSVEQIPSFLTTSVILKLLEV